jgi:hypothetical protein
MVWLRGAVARHGNITDATIDLVDADGAPIAHLAGFRQKIYDSSDPYLEYLLGDDPAARLVRGLAGPQGELSIPAPSLEFRGSGGVWIRLLARLALAPGERAEFAQVADDGRPAWLMSRVLAKLAVTTQGPWKNVRLCDLEAAEVRGAFLVRRTSHPDEACEVDVKNTSDRLWVAAVAGVPSVGNG